MTKIGFVSSEKPDAIKSLKMMEQTYDSVPPEKADIIVALGGDGTMLKSLHDFLHLNKPIYGMNRGHIGFLMNQFSEKNLKKRLDSYNNLKKTYGKEAIEEAFKNQFGISFEEIARKYLFSLGYEVFECTTEEEARKRINELVPLKKWPCYFFKSDTTGEKEVEEFYSLDADLDLERLLNIGIIRNKMTNCIERLEKFKIDN